CWVFASTILGFLSVYCPSNSLIWPPSSALRTKSAPYDEEPSPLGGGECLAMFSCWPISRFCSATCCSSVYRLLVRSSTEELAATLSALAAFIWFCDRLRAALRYSSLAFAIPSCRILPST